MRGKFFLALFFISVECFAADAATGFATSAPITAEDYCAFLNQTATSDPFHFYDAKMARTLESACILRFGAPGSYRYEAEGGRLRAEGEDKKAASDPIAFLSQNDALQNDTLKNKNGFSFIPQPSASSPITFLSYNDVLQYCAWKNKNDSLSLIPQPFAFSLAPLCGACDEDLKSNIITWQLINVESPCHAANGVSAAAMSNLESEEIFAAIAALFGGAAVNTHVTDDVSAEEMNSIRTTTAANEQERENSILEEAPKKNSLQQERESSKASSALLPNLMTLKNEAPAKKELFATRAEPRIQQLWGKPELKNFFKTQLVFFNIPDAQKKMQKLFLKFQQTVSAAYEQAYPRHRGQKDFAHTIAHYEKRHQHLLCYAKNYEEALQYSTELPIALRLGRKEENSWLRVMWLIALGHSKKIAAEKKEAIRIDSILLFKKGTAGRRQAKESDRAAREARQQGHPAIAKLFEQKVTAQRDAADAYTLAGQRKKTDDAESSATYLKQARAYEKKSNALTQQIAALQGNDQKNVELFQKIAETHEKVATAYLLKMEEELANNRQAAEARRKEAAAYERQADVLTQMAAALQQNNQPLAGLLQKIAEAHQNAADEYYLSAQKKEGVNAHDKKASAYEREAEALGDRLGDRRKAEGERRRKKSSHRQQD